MEFCSNCQALKPYRLAEFCVTYISKVCRDCGMGMGSITIDNLNKVVNERNFYKKKFYERELQDGKET
jgi:hypothetical protein